MLSPAAFACVQARRTAAGVKVERPTGRTTLMPAKDGILLGAKAPVGSEHLAAMGMLVVAVDQKGPSISGDRISRLTWINESCGRGSHPRAERVMPGAVAGCRRRRYRSDR